MKMKKVAALLVSSLMVLSVFAGAVAVRIVMEQKR